MQIDRTVFNRIHKAKYPIPILKQLHDALPKPKIRSNPHSWEIILQCPICRMVPTNHSKLYACKNGHFSCNFCFNVAELKCPLCRCTSVYYQQTSIMALLNLNITGITSCGLCDYSGTYNQLWIHKNEFHKNKVRFPAPAPPPMQVNRSAYTMTQILKCDFCHELPPANSPIVGCQLGHQFCIADQPAQGICTVPFCNSRCDSRLYVLEEATNYALKLEDYTCNIKDCQYKHNLHVMASHQKHCVHPLTRPNTTSFYTNESNFTNDT